LPPGLDIDPATGLISGTLAFGAATSIPFSEVIEEFAYPQYDAMYDGETDGVWSPTCGRTMPLISAVES
jgi:hypothetical protein